MRLPEFFSELRSAVEYLHGEPGIQIEAFSGFWRLFRAVEMMLTSISEDLGLNLDKRPTMGSRAAAIRNAGILPADLARTLETIIRQRNMIAHARIVDDIKKEDLEPFLTYVLLLFKWYLTAYREGLRLSETAAEAVLEDIICVRIGGEQIPRRIFLCYAKEDFARVTELYKSDASHQMPNNCINRSAGSELLNVAFARGGCAALGFPLFELCGRCFVIDLCPRQL